MSGPSFVSAAWAFALCGCASAPLFRGAANVAALAPDERVIVGQIRYASGDLAKLLPEPYVGSWPRFTYDYTHREAPRYEQPQRMPPFGPEGGVFALRAKQRPVYLESVIAETRKLYGDHVLWTLPVTLKLPVSPARCAYVGTIVIDVSGPQKKSSAWETFGGVELPKDQVHATVVDDFERDRAVLAGYVEGCDLQRDLAERPSDDELRALVPPPPSQKSSEGHWRSEADRIRKH
jgi:hypothetical protein